MINIRVGYLGFVTSTDKLTIVTSLKYIGLSHYTLGGAQDIVMQLYSVPFLE